MRTSRYGRGRAIAAEYEFPAVAPGTICPLRFGEVVRLFDGTKGVVLMPNQGATFFSLLEIDGRGAPLPRAGQTISTWESVRERVGDYELLSAALRSRIQPFRKAVQFEGTHWARGVDFLEAQDRPLLERADWSELRSRLFHGCDQVEEFFAGEPARSGPRFRVLLHAGCESADWRRFGPMTRNEARALIRRLEREMPPPKELARGVYKASKSRMNKWELYDGLRL